jgi:hypothetical protein
MRRAASVRVLLVAAVLAALAAGSTRDGASASPTATRVVDRTLLCRVGYSNGARLLLLTVRSASRGCDELEWLAHATVATPGNPLSRQNSQPTLAGVSAGWPPPPPFASGGLGYDNTRCGPSRVKVPLSPKGLTGGVASAFGEDLRCIVGKSVLVRVRATFRRAVEEEPDKAGDFVSALGRMATGQIAVRTRAGKPLVYVDVADGGRARLFTKGCS